MENQNVENYNAQMRERTVKMAVKVYNLFKSKTLGQLNQPMVRQLLRSSSSVAANSRAATRARSDAEFYSKICIIVEECDETQFWVDFLIRIELLSKEETRGLINEVDELLKIYTSIKKKMKDKSRMSK